MGSRDRPLFDLNEPPTEEEDNSVICLQPKKAIPILNPRTSGLLFPLPEGSHRIVNNHAFTHSSSGSGFQPFVKFTSSQNMKNFSIQRTDDNMSNCALMPGITSDSLKDSVPVLTLSDSQDAQATEREEGELEGNATLETSYSIKHEADNPIIAHKQGETEDIEPGSVRSDTNGEFNLLPSNSTEGDASKRVTDHDYFGQESSRSSEGSYKGNMIVGGLGGLLPVVKNKENRGIEASHTSRIANNHGKKSKLGEHKQAMLGKKRARQTVFINIEDAKQAGPIKTSMPRRQTSFPAPVITRTVIDRSHASLIASSAEQNLERQIASSVEQNLERQIEPVMKDQKQFNLDSEGTPGVTNERKTESDGDLGLQIWKTKMKSNGSHSEIYPPPLPRQSSLKQSIDHKKFKDPLVSSKRQNTIDQHAEDAKLGHKKHLSSKEQTSVNIHYQDTSVERLLREVTNDKFWHHPEAAELQRVPGCFESVEDYVGVFEPLLFEECRAQLSSTWEDLTETGSKDTHTMVRVKTVEKRERGWYDVIVLPVHECKWTYKEGDVAVLSTPRPGAVGSKKKNMKSGANEEHVEAEITGSVSGTVRRHTPIDTRDPPGATLHFYVGDSYDSSSKSDDHVLKKLQSKSYWYLTVLGTLATTQREYIALHAFQRFDLQMQTAILKPNREHFPKYEDQPPAMPECFTLDFVTYLRKTFNDPQLSAIQWAAMHTATGTSCRSIKKQEPWPFTLVQGPPGTGKTHTVWGMLNVIHLVQYQHYYTALLKKLAPECYKQTSESNNETVSSGSIDIVLQNIDQNLFRSLPKLCPKPRMLVCAPSNAATDELLARVLDRGFIDGEMKVYRPDVARVGVDSQTRAAQTVSVERRTEQLLIKSREEVVGWMHELKAQESQYSQQIDFLQRELNGIAAAGRSQGSVSVDPDLVLEDPNRHSLLQKLAAAVEERDKVLVEMSRFLILESRFRTASSFNLEEVRASLEASYANEAEIVFTTLSSSGRKIFSRLSHGFDMVVIDEAAQASEVALLTPLSLGAARCVLVGDPQQLPATVISKAAGNLLYSRSLFERFQQSGCPTILLSVQYRMHPQIRDFPSRHFYQGRLTDSESVANLADEIYYRENLLQPYIFYDIMHGRESHKGGSLSYQNIHEAQFSLRLYEHLQKFLKSIGGKKVSVGIITPYKLQLKCLQREFEEVMNSEEGKDLYINTVDAFQGQERDVIIMSCVRASNRGVGFVADIRRMNVALTRARRALWVVGNANALMKSDDWGTLIMDAKSRKCFRDTDSIPKELFVRKGTPNSTHGKSSSSNSKPLRTIGPRHKF